MDLKKLEKYKYPLLILLVGVVLMLIPSRSSQSTSAQDSQELSLRSALESADGVGQAYVLISEKGVVVVCEGADKAQVRLDIIKAVGAYTGYGSNKIVILKMVKN